MLLRLSKEHFGGRSGFLKFREQKMQKRSYDFVCGIIPPSLSNTEKEDAGIIQDIDPRYLQRVVATRCYYSSSATRYDSVMVRAETSKSCSPDDEQKSENEVQLRNVLVRSLVCKEVGEEKECSLYNRRP